MPPRISDLFGDRDRPASYYGGPNHHYYNPRPRSSSIAYSTSSGSRVKERNPTIHPYFPNETTDSLTEKFDRHGFRDPYEEEWKVVKEKEREQERKKAAEKVLYPYKTKVLEGEVERRKEEKKKREREEAYEAWKAWKAWKKSKSSERVAEYGFRMWRRS